MPPPFHIDLVDPATAADDLLDRWIDLSNARRAATQPGDPAMSHEDGRRAARSIPDTHKQWLYAVSENDGRFAGSVSWMLDPKDDNPDLLVATPWVRPDCRRQGVGGMLLAELSALAKTQGRTRMLVATTDVEPSGAEFAQAVGFVEKLREHVNHLPIGAVDRAQLEGWVNDAASRSNEYELLSFTGAIPDDLIADYVELIMVMNTAPRDDLEVNDFTLTVDNFRQMETQTATIGYERWTMITRHAQSGALAGYHDVIWHPTMTPTVVQVGATAVDPAHRGHALGKWLKAAMTLRILDERPGVTEVRTENTDSNDAMLGINNAMGYRPLRAGALWEGTISAVADWVTNRGLVPTIDPTTLHRELQAEA